MRFRLAAFGVACAVAVCPTSPVAQCAENAAPIAFSIPSQPLVSAISSYGDATGSEALYDAGLAAGRISNNVQGTMTPAEGLDRLLIGTGLSARFVSNGRFVVTAPAALSGASEMPLQAAHRHYYGVLQQGLLDALCPLRDARPGHYRIVMALSLSATGEIEQARRVGSAGTEQADRQIDETLRGFRFAEQPPAGFAQPVRILLSPEVPGGTRICASADMRLGARGVSR